MEPIIAYRVWSYGADQLLGPVGVNPACVPRWEPCKPYSAVCAHDAHSASRETHDFHSHAGLEKRSPVTDCSCGIYAFKETKLVIDHACNPTVVVGRVALWGRIEEHEKGYRAEYAYPAAFYMTQCFSALGPELVRELADRYKVDIVPTPDALREAFEISRLARDAASTSFAIYTSMNIRRWALAQPSPTQAPPRRQSRLNQLLNIIAWKGK